MSEPAHVASRERLVEPPRTVLLAFVAAAAVSVAAVALVLALQFISVALLFGWLAVIAIATRPRLGLYLAFAVVVLFESSSADPLMALGTYLQSGFSSTLGLDAAIVSPLEILLVLTFLSWLAQGLVTRRSALRGGRLLWPMGLFAAALAFGLVRGAAAGGDLTVALWESRYLCYAVMCYFLAASTIRTPRHVAILTGIALVGTTLFALEASFRHLVLIEGGLLQVPREFLFAHEDVVFLASALVLVLAQWAFGAPPWRQLFGAAAVPVIAFALLAGERRAGFVAVAIALLAAGLVLLVARRRAFFQFVFPLILATAVYLPLFWGDTGLLGQPARALRSVYEPNARDAASNVYRILETINVRATILQDPLLGVGFGRPFLFVVPLPDLSWWPFWRYEPHNNVLWVWLKTGIVGFVLFWLLVGAALARAAHHVRWLTDPMSRTFALFALGVVVVVLVFSYVDLGLVSGRVTVLLGTTLGTLAVLEDVAGQREVPPPRRGA